MILLHLITHLIFVSRNQSRKVRIRLVRLEKKSLQKPEKMVDVMSLGNLL